MKLNQFIEESVKRMTAFERYWLKSRKENPEQFSEDLEPGQWEEMFFSWSEEND